MEAISVSAGTTNPGSNRRFPPDKLSKYLKGGHRSVQGWLVPFSAQAIAFLLDVQSKTGVKGSVGEIGVHHGKLFLVAYLSALSDEAAFAIDVFEQQDLNLDKSGKGDRERFLENLKRHAGSTDGLVVMVEDSLRLKPERILTAAGAARFMSIDGGHTDECTRHDLRLAEACLAGGGIIVLDDYFNHHWPDVSVGAASHFLSGRARTKPFLITPNKVFFCEDRYHGRYQMAFRAAFRRHYVRRSRMFGSAVDIYVREGLQSLRTVVSGLIEDEARIRLAKYPQLKAMVRSLTAR